ncbi:micronuclear linker histone polyprotein [Halyomorpha halys]|uniref:micronuclear linker histone polyprotein n=1 Tax=Halyomorpha halys TaxID=286706 RepID=UPI0006D4FB30|nr:uncharacterized protein DDB_G0292642-like [Halyomorpha halys]
MPVRKCVLCGKSSIITSKEGSNTSYFSFPRDENLRKKWIDVCHSKIDNIITARICSNHFKEDDFIYYKNGTEEVRKKRLKCNVVPSFYSEAKRGKQFQNNINVKNSNKENSKDSVKKRDSSKDTESIKDQSSILQSKRKSSSGNKNNQSTRDQIKKKIISENNRHPNLFPKQKIGKGLNSMEKTKESIKRKNQLKNISLGIKEISKKRNDKELSKKKSKLINNISVKKDMHKHKIIKKSINKENQRETTEEKLNNLPSDTRKDISKEDLTRSLITKSSKTELNRKRSHTQINSEDQNKNIMENNSKFPKEEPTINETSDINEVEMSSEILEKKDASENNSKNVKANKKPAKRKSFMANGVPRKMHKKRIRLGKDDSEDSDDSSSECRSTNNLSKDKITYKSPSEMADNKDLLKYLNYLKEKSRSSDQPILFWVDD